jgi:hypothetical protein
VVDGSGLENRRTRKGTGGSNPSLSASILDPALGAGFRGWFAIPLGLNLSHPTYIYVFGKPVTALSCGFVSKIVSK